MKNISNKLIYKTVSKEARDYLIEKKSKFIASVSPAETEDDALKFLNKIKKEFPDATHNVYAYVIDENQIFRYSDDGEPSQTAGMPVLDTIRKEGLVDIAVVVTRYFGGTLLGTGGLVRAYGNSANLGISKAGIITRMLCNVIAIKTDYNMSGKIQYKIMNDHIILEDTIYTDEVTFYVSVLTTESESFINEIIDTSNGTAICTIIDTKYVDKN